MASIANVAAGRAGLPSSPARARLDSLTGLRAVASMLVFIHHVAPTAPLISEQGASGVTFFFMLSGFVLTWSHQDHDRISDFYRRRFARIYPAYLTALVAALILRKEFRDALFVPHLLSALTLTQSWVPRSDYVFAIDGPAWSLSCEAFFYVLFPLFIGRLMATSVTRRRMIMAAMCVISISIALLEGSSSVYAVGWLGEHAPFIRISQFVLGAALAAEVIHDGVPRIPWAGAVLFAAVGYLAAGSGPAALGNVAIPFIPFGVLLVSAAQADLEGRRTGLAGRTMVKLGAISYCFYLIHDPIIQTIGLPSGRPAQVAAAAGLLVLCTLAALALHELVEKPLERRLRGKAGRRPPVTVAPFDT